MNIVVTNDLLSPQVLQTLVLISLLISAMALALAALAMRHGMSDGRLRREISRHVAEYDRDQAYKAVRNAAFEAWEMNQRRCPTVAADPDYRDDTAQVNGQLVPKWMQDEFKMPSDESFQRPAPHTRPFPPFTDQDLGDADGAPRGNNRPGRHS